MNKNLPNIFILGASKCGTTSLFDYLNEFNAPNYISMKEPHIFNQKTLSEEQINYTFHETTNFRIDATPTYLNESDVVFRNIQQFYGDDMSKLKFIILIRDPVERAYSHFEHLQRNGHFDLKFEDYLLGNDDRFKIGRRNWQDIVGESNYTRNIRDTLSYINSSSVLVGNGTKINSKNLVKIHEFLSLNETIRNYPYSNKGTMIRYKRLYSFLYGTKITKKIVRSVVPADYRQEISGRIKKLFRSDVPKSGLINYREYGEYFEKDIQFVKRLQDRFVSGEKLLDLLD